MDSELEGVFERAEELLQELRAEYRRCLDGRNVTERAKNLFHEVIIKVRSALDMTMVRVWQKYAAPHLTPKRRQRLERRVCFPICDDFPKFHKMLKEYGLDSLMGANKSLHDLILRAQPFSTKRRDLCWLRDFANLGKHVRLAPQEVTARAAKLVASPRGTVVYDNVEFFGEQIMGAPIDPETRQPLPTAEVTVKDVTWVEFVVEGCNVDPIIFCSSLCQGARTFVEGVVRHM